MSFFDFLGSDAAAATVEQMPWEAIRPWHIIVTAFGCLLIYSTPAIIRARNQKYEIRRKYDMKQRLATEKQNRLNAKKSKGRKVR